MTKEELEKATGQELIYQRNYCGVDGYYGDYLDNVNAEMLKRFNRLADLEAENAELRKVAEFQQSNNMNTHLENKKLKEGLAVGSTWNKHLNSLNKELEEERDKYRNMVFDKDEQLTKARVLLKQFLEARNGEDTYKAEFEAEQFLKE